MSIRIAIAKPELGTEEIAAVSRVLESGMLISGRLVEESFWTPDRNELTPMRGRVRLCPYYFTGESSVTCGGALATICPDDKKLLHGMRDAILAPTGAES